MSRIKSLIIQECKKHIVAMGLRPSTCQDMNAEHLQFRDRFGQCYDINITDGNIYIWGASGKHNNPIQIELADPKCFDKFKDCINLMTLRGLIIGLLQRNVMDFEIDELVDITQVMTNKYRHKLPTNSYTNRAITFIEEMSKCK